MAKANAHASTLKQTTLKKLASEVVMVCSKSLTSVVRTDASWPMLFLSKYPRFSLRRWLPIESLRSAVMSAPRNCVWGVVRRVQRGAHDEQHDEHAAVERKQLGVERAGDEVDDGCDHDGEHAHVQKRVRAGKRDGQHEVLALSPLRFGRFDERIMPATPSSPCGACRRPTCGRRRRLA